MSLSPLRDPTAALPFAHGGPIGSGVVKQAPEDFVVEEVLTFQPSGAGEHAFIKVRKRGENTEFVARQLAKLAGVPVRNVGYAGLKDRHGATTQWLSVQLPGQDSPDWSALDSDRLKILESTRNDRKLRKGAAAGNRFEVTIRELSAEPCQIAKRLADISERGFPNYFGPQRFGHQGGNLALAKALFAGSHRENSPHKRGLLLSAARSEIFNRVLARRVTHSCWDRPIAGDAMMFSGARSFFVQEVLTPELNSRAATGEIHPSGPLWGSGSGQAVGAAAELEGEVARELDDLRDGLERLGVEMARRPLRVIPADLRYEFSELDAVKLCFRLPSGAYATALLRELIGVDLSGRG